MGPSLARVEGIVDWLPGGTFVYQCLALFCFHFCLLSFLPIFLYVLTCLLPGRSYCLLPPTSRVRCARLHRPPSLLPPPLAFAGCALLAPLRAQLYRPLISCTSPSRRRCTSQNHPHVRLRPPPTHKPKSEPPSHTPSLACVARIRRSHAPLALPFGIHGQFETIQRRLAWPLRQGYVAHATRVRRSAVLMFVYAVVTVVYAAAPVAAPPEVPLGPARY